LSTVLETEPSSSRSACSTGSRRDAHTEAILRAALEELADVGYSAFSIESVATRVGIAKTTVYRRYPTKIDLVRSAIRKFVDDAVGDVPDTGSLRGDLVALGNQSAQIAASVLGQSLFRTRLLERVCPELEKMGEEFELEHEQIQRRVAARAIERGELSNEADFVSVVQVLSGAILFRLIIKKRSVDELEITRIVDLLLNGISRSSVSATRSRYGF
jgi:AcrR family transcriptional regulator